MNGVTLCKILSKCQERINYSKQDSKKMNLINKFNEEPKSNDQCFENLKCFSEGFQQIVKHYNAKKVLKAIIKSEFEGRFYLKKA